MGGVPGVGRQGCGAVGAPGSARRQREQAAAPEGVQAGSRPRRVPRSWPWLKGDFVSKLG